MIGGARVVHAIATVAFLAASQAGDASCNVDPWACNEDTRGIKVVNGAVTDLITVTCDPPPRTHRLDAWIDYKAAGGEWNRGGDEEVSKKRPEPTLELPISSWNCKPGEYRAHWRVNGTSGNAGETLFTRESHDVWGTEVTAEECTGG